MCHKGGELEKHVQVHDGKQLVSFDFCNKIIDQSSNMEKHEKRMHTQDLPHKCKNCEVKLVNNTTIMNHSTDMHWAEYPKECGNVATEPYQKSTCQRTAVSKSTNALSVLKLLQEWHTCLLLQVISMKRTLNECEVCGKK